MTNLLLLGAGRMGLAMLEGWLKTPDLLEKVAIVDPSADVSLYDEYKNITCVKSVEELPAGWPVDMAVIAVKPQIFDRALPALKEAITSSSLVISVAAGKTVQEIRSFLDADQPVVRCMPNIAATIGQSASGLYASENVDEKARDEVSRLFDAIGSAIWTAEEHDFHAITAVSGSGPAYFFAMCEAMIKAGVAQGLSLETATGLVIETAAGAGALLKQNKDAAALRTQVTSPNGTTQAGLEKMFENEKIQTLMSETIEAAHNRSVELSHAS